MPPANILTALPADQQKTLAIFSCQAFQRGGDWQEITFKLPGQALPQVFQRSDLEGLVVTQATNLAQRLPTTQQTELLAKVGDLKTNAAGIGQQLLETEITTQPGSSSARLLQQYQQHLANLTDQIGIQPITLKTVDGVKQAVAANESLQQNLKEVNQTIEDNLQAKYSPEVKKDRAQAISGVVTQTIVGKLEENQDLTPQLAYQTSQRVRQPLIFDAAIANSGRFTAGLTNSFSSLQQKKTSVIADYNSLRNFQISIDATFWPVAEQLAGAGLDIPQINKTIGYLEQNLDRISSNWELQHYLRQELGKYPQLGRKVNSLASQISLGLTVQKANSRLAKPTAQARLEALATHVYCVQGTTAAELRQNGLHGLADKVEQLARDPKLQKIHQKTLAQQQQQKQKWDKIFAQRQKAANKRQFLATHNRGWVLAPRMRLSMALDKSAGWRRVKTFAPKVTPGYWINRGSRVVRKQIGNWLINQGLDQAGQAFLSAGFRGLFKHVLAKVGLGSLLGPVGTAVGLGLAVLGNKDLRDFFGSLLGGAGFLIYYLFVKLPLTVAFAAFGFITFGPVGLALGGIGFALDQAIGGLGGLGKAAGAALPKAAAATEAASSIPVQASLTPVTNVAAGVPVVGALAGTIFGALVAFMGFTSAASLPPESAAGGAIATGSATPASQIGSPSGPITFARTSAEYLDLTDKVLKALRSCGLPPPNDPRYQTYSQVNQDNWSKVKGCLKAENVDDQTIAALEDHLSRNQDLQCLGFVANITGLTMLLYARDYCSRPELQTNWSNLKAGDLLVANTSWGGHIAIVTLVDGDIVKVVESLGSGFGGAVGEKRLGKSQLSKDFYGLCGYLRGG
jgi:hypothetical protein